MFEIKLNKSKADIYYKSDFQTSKNARCNISMQPHFFEGSFGSP
jgi:hypothetical protein